MLPEHHVNAVAVVVRRAAYFDESFCHGVQVGYCLVKDSLVMLSLFLFCVDVLHPLADGFRASLKLYAEIGVFRFILADGFLFAFLFVHCSSELGVDELLGYGQCRAGNLDFNFIHEGHGFHQLVSLVLQNSLLLIDAVFDTLILGFEILHHFYGAA